jgi:hypothetical protein
LRRLAADCEADRKDGNGPAEVLEWAADGWHG